MEKLGLTGTDSITGFSGVIVGYCAYLSGCNQLLLVPPMNKKDGTLRDGQWFDVQRITTSKAKRVQLQNEATPGHDKQAPKY